MSIRNYFILIACMLLCACANNPALCSHHCGVDYWGDCRTEIFAVNNTVGCTGRWIDEDNGRSGYYCKNLDCSLKEHATVPFTCSCSYNSCCINH